MWVAVGLGLAIGAVTAIGYALGEPLRRHAEEKLNESLTGYRAAIGGLDFLPARFGFSLDDVNIKQIAHPDPPVIDLQHFRVGIDWRALLHLKLVAAVEVDRPRLHVDSRQLDSERTDEKALQDKGWQEAVESVYPLDINRLVINDGEIVYIDRDPKAPIALKGLQVWAIGLRNRSLPGERYPALMHATAAVFDTGYLRLDGRANFLAAPEPDIDAEIELDSVPLKKLHPIASLANLQISAGTLDARGTVQTSAEQRNAHLQHASVDGLRLDYVHSAATAAAESRRMDQVSETAGNIAKDPDLRVDIDELRLTKADLGYVDEAGSPPYRVFMNGTDVTVRALTTGKDAKQPAHVVLSGSFMGSGATRVNALVRPHDDRPDFDLAMQIEKTNMKSMNDLLSNLAGIDVVAGEFSFYSELKVRDNHIDGYVKPLFSDLDVYDRRQDRGDPLGQQIKEGVVGGLAALLENRRDQVATEGSVKGDTADPEVSTWQIVFNLLRNAFFNSIMPGLEEHLRDREAAQ
ncbi:MAG: DUF748 domain-containing protein [bacterium]